MLFNSTAFLLFFPLVTLVYFVLPSRVRWCWLLVCSYWFYMGWNARYALLLAASTLLTWVSGLLITGAASNAHKKLWVTLCLCANLGMLFFFKYFDFAARSLSAILARVGLPLALPQLDILLPVGISFFIFQALSYTLDVYRGEVPAEKNPFRYALFVSFFPQLVAGPIERSKNLLHQVWELHEFDYDRVRDGLLLMLWGYFEKVVIADRASIFVTAVFDQYAACAGAELIVAILLFAVQIYCDFGGYSHIAIGAAQVLGFTLTPNFRQPYFSRTIGEFWKRWHISLSSWLQDYLYFPLGGSRCGQWRTYLNLMIVFLASGIWHGAAWTYVAWGVLHGLYNVVGRATRPTRQKLYTRLGVRTEVFSWRLWQRLCTFTLVCIGWVLFRAPSLGAALGTLRQIATTWDPWMLLDGGLYAFGLSRHGFWLLLAAIALLFWVDAKHEKGVQLRKTFAAQNCLFRWGVTVLAVLAVLVLGAYGPGVNQSQFIYFQF